MHAIDDHRAPGPARLGGCRRRGRRGAARRRIALRHVLLRGVALEAVRNQRLALRTRRNRELQPLELDVCDPARTLQETDPRRARREALHRHQRRNVGAPAMTDDQPLAAHRGLGEEVDVQRPQLGVAAEMLSEDIEHVLPKVRREERPHRNPGDDEKCRDDDSGADKQSSSHARSVSEPEPEPFEP